MINIDDYYLRVEEAVQCYLDRKDRLEHPEGKFDRASRWYPSDQEEQDCCKDIRRPSRNYPYSLMLNCRTKKHIANLYEVETKDMNVIIRSIRAAEADLNL